MLAAAGSGPTTLTLTRTARSRAPPARALAWFARTHPASPPAPAAQSAASDPPSHHSSPPASRSDADPDFDADAADLVIVGGGPAGLTLAAALAADPRVASTHAITLIEGGSLAPLQDTSPTFTDAPYSNRVSSLTADTIRHLTRAGIWAHLDQSRTRALDELQVWDGLSDARIEFAAPFLASTSSAAGPGDGDAWDAAYAAALRPRRAAMSTMVENTNLQRAALRRIDQCVREHGARVRLLDAQRVHSIQRGEGGWPVVTVRPQGDSSGSGTRLRARLLIGADGANSPVKSFSNIDTFGWAYDRRGIVATLTVDPLVPGEGMSTGWQRFLPEGPIAFLPLSDTHASLVWSTTPEYASAIQSLPLEVLPHLVSAAFTLPYEQLRAFLDAIVPPRSSPGSTPSSPPAYDAAALSAQLRDALLAHSQATYDPSNPANPLPPSVTAVQPGSVAAFPLRLSHTSSYLGLPFRDTALSGPAAVAQDARTVLVGDAAHTVHPLAGQGLNLGLADAFSLANVLGQRAAQGADLGAYLGLKEYARDRYVRNHAVLSACDHLASLYARTDRVSVWARSTGVEVLNELEPIKRLMMAQAGASGGGGGGGGGGTGTGGAGGAGAWGAVAGALEGMGKVRDVVGTVASAVVGQVGRRAAEFVVKGR